MIVEWLDLDPVGQCEWVRYVANVEGWHELVKLAAKAGLPVESASDLRERGAEKCTDPEARRLAESNPRRILWLDDSPEGSGWKAL